MILLLPLYLAVAAASPPDWSEGFLVPVGGRSNPYQLESAALASAIRAGRTHALHYPVNASAMILPYTPLKGLIDFANIEAWLGLQTYPKSEGQGAYQTPLTPNFEHRMGFTLLKTPDGLGFSISCAECHAGNLFGRRVIGMSNRFPRANRLFTEALQVIPTVGPDFFQWFTGATDGERRLYERSRFATQFIGAKEPVALGLDTSLAQVAMSLARRAEDAWATRLEDRPVREEPLAQKVADSKPAVWWNVKYKNRWLSDGSVVSGNPIFTNIIWNEIGRGSDLQEVKTWLDRNESVIRDLTAAVFAAEAPRFTDFFSPTFLPEESARAGEQIFKDHCARCHGVYEKAWSRPEANSLSPRERLRTVQVVYPSATPVIDVGTDSSRYRGMKSLAQLNRLAISKGITIKPQRGYVPPPLEGIWARWPYFHNNSAPTLCAVLTEASQRPRTYWAREANDPERDFDRVCNGYPRSRPMGASDEMFYDSSLKGLSNSGHEHGVALRPQDKAHLILFLQTL